MPHPNMPLVFSHIDPTAPLPPVREPESTVSGKVTCGVYVGEFVMSVPNSKLRSLQDDLVTVNRIARGYFACLTNSAHHGVFAREVVLRIPMRSGLVIQVDFVRTDELTNADVQGKKPVSAKKSAAASSAAAAAAAAPVAAPAAAPADAPASSGSSVEIVIVSNGDSESASEKDETVAQLPSD